MVRIVIYTLMGLPIGALSGFGISGVVSDAFWGALIRSVIGFSIAVLVNATQLLDRPFWNRPDVERFIQHKNSVDAILPPALQERFFAWIRSRIKD